MRAEIDGLCPADVPGGPSVWHRELLARTTSLARHLEPRIPVRFRSQIAADDVVQDALLAAARGARGYSGKSGEELNRWLWRVAENCLVDRIRELRTLKRGGQALPNQRWSSLGELLHDLKSVGRTPSSDAAATEARHAVGLVLEGLPASWREAIQLRYMGGLTDRAIAKRMGKSPMAVRGLIYRGMAALREQLGTASKYLSDVLSDEAVVED